MKKLGPRAHQRELRSDTVAAVRDHPVVLAIGRPEGRHYDGIHYDSIRRDVFADVARPSGRPWLIQVSPVRRRQPMKYAVLLAVVLARLPSRRSRRRSTSTSSTSRAETRRCSSRRQARRCSSTRATAARPPCAMPIASWRRSRTRASRRSTRSSRRTGTAITWAPWPSSPAVFRFATILDHGGNVQPAEAVDEFLQKTLSGSDRQVEAYGGEGGRHPAAERRRVAVRHVGAGDASGTRCRARGARIPTAQDSRRTP